MPNQTTNSQTKRKQLAIPVANKTTKVRPKVQCYCKGCNGKWVDSRTRDKHYIEDDNLQLVMKEPPVKKRKDDYQIIGIIQPAISKSCPVGDTIQMIDHDINEQYNLNSIYAGKKRQRYDQFLNPNNIDIHLDVEVDQQPSDDDDFSSVDDLPLPDDDVLNEQFFAPDVDDFDVPGETHMKFTDSWIILWTFKFQMRFRLSDSSINALIQFFKLVLSDVDKNRFKELPSSAYMAKKLMGFVKKSRTYAVCPSCNKLFNPTEIVQENSANNENSGAKCGHIEFHIIQ